MRRSLLLSLFAHKMNDKTKNDIRGAVKLNHIQRDAPNWVIIAGGVLLSTLTFHVGRKLKQVFDRKQATAMLGLPGKGNSATRRTPGVCQSQANIYTFALEQENCCCCHSGAPTGRVDVKQVPSSMSPKEIDPNLSLVKIAVSEANKDGVAMWTSSPNQLELPRKPFWYSNNSNSPCASESGSDIHSKREVIRKLRQQVTSRDEMIMEMQTQISDLQSTLNIQMTQSGNLQSQLDSANQDLFNSEREIQHLRKLIVNNSNVEAYSGEKPAVAMDWHSETMNGHMNAYSNSIENLKLHCCDTEKSKGNNGERVEMLKREVMELKEVIEGKDFLIQTYKEQKVELCSKLKELQLKLSLQPLNIL